jgi:hypothetical protein
MSKNLTQKSAKLGGFQRRARRATELLHLLMLVSCLVTTIIVWVVKWGTVSATGQRKETELLNGN